MLFLSSGSHKIELIVIGGSAGGIQAMTSLLAGLPADLGVAVTLALHMPPNRPSLLPELFGRHCKLPVKEAEDKEPIAPGIVYLAAPDYHLLIEPDRRFALSCDDPVNYSRPSIDMLFESAAMAYRSSVLGIVLSGANSDGADGLVTIRHGGGLSWVQDPGEAQTAVMPLAAIERAGADAVLTTGRMADLLASAPKVAKESNI
jgi:two-component system, chemotaxis family, protein-glutamate methylesterase/glutaminase